MLEFPWPGTLRGAPGLLEPGWDLPVLAHGRLADGLSAIRACIQALLYAAGAALQAAFQKGCARILRLTAESKAPA